MSVYTKFQPPCTATSNYSGSGRLGSGRSGSGRSKSDNRASSVQLQLQVPAETELGKRKTERMNDKIAGFLLLKDIYASDTF